MATNPHGAASRQRAVRPRKWLASHLKRRLTREADLKRAAEKAILENLTVPIPVAGKALGMGRNKSYAAAKTGQLQCVGTGKKRVAITAPIRQRLGLVNHATA